MGLSHNQLKELLFFEKSRLKFFFENKENGKTAAERALAYLQKINTGDLLQNPAYIALTNLNKLVSNDDASINEFFAINTKPIAFRSMLPKDADINSPDVKSLASFFDIINSLIADYSKRNYKEAIDDSGSKIKDFENQEKQLTLSLQSYAKELDDLGIRFSDIEKEIADNEKALGDSADEYKQYVDEMKLHTEDGERLLRAQISSNNHEIENLETENKTLNGIDQYEENISALEEFKKTYAYAELKTKGEGDVKELEDSLKELDAEVDRLYELTNSYDNMQKVSVYWDHKKAYERYMSDPDTKAGLEEYYEAVRRANDLSNVLNHKAKLTKEMYAEGNNKILTDQYAEQLSKVSLLRVKNAQIIAKFEEAKDYIENPENKELFDSFENGKVRYKQLLEKRPELTEKLKEEKKKQAEEKRKVLDKCKINMKDSDLEKLSFSEIPDLIENTLNSHKEKIVSIKNSDKYKDNLNQISKLSEYNNKFNPDIIVPKANELAKKNVRLGKLKAALEKGKELSQKTDEINAAKNDLKKTLADNTSNVKIDDTAIASMLEDFNNNIENVSRKKNSGFLENPEAFVANNSKEFVQLRTTLYAANNVFKSNADAQTKKDILEELQKQAKDYLDQRNKQNPWFQSSTRKFRMTFIKNLSDFTEKALSNLSLPKPETNIEDIENFIEEDSPLSDEFLNRLDAAKDLEIEADTEEIAESQKIEISEKIEKEEEVTYEKFVEEREKAYSKQQRDKWANELDEKMHSIIPEGSTIVYIHDKLTVSKSGDDTSNDFELSDAQLAEYLALQSTKAIISNPDTPDNLIKGFLEDYSIKALAEGIQTSDVFRSYQNNLSKKEFYDAQDVSEFFKNFDSKFSAECQKLNSKDFYIENIKRRMDVISPQTSTSKLELVQNGTKKEPGNITPNEIAKFVYYKTLLNNMKNMDEKQLKHFLSDSEIKKQTEYIKEYDTFNKFLDEIKEESASKKVSNQQLNGLGSSYSKGDWDKFELKPRKADEIIRQVKPEKKLSADELLAKQISEKRKANVKGGLS